MIVRNLPDIVIHQYDSFRDSMRQGFAGAQARAWLSALRMTPRMLRKRRAIQRTRRVDVDYLDTVVTPSGR